MYWELSEDTFSLSNNMSRNRFKEIKKFLHLAVNSNLNLTDKMAKVRPLDHYKDYYAKNFANLDVSKSFD